MLYNIYAHVVQHIYKVRTITTLCISLQPQNVHNVEIIIN